MKADTRSISSVTNGNPLQPLRIAVYTSPWGAIANPTGVGQHITHMTQCLAEDPDVSTTILATRREYHRAQASFPESLAELPVRYLPGSDRWTRDKDQWP